jgi:multiple sugar transport system permease protein
MPNGHVLEMEHYLDRLKESPHYGKEIADRVPRQCWDVMRRECPYGEDCPFCRDEWGVEAPAKHYHVWAFPQGPVVMTLLCRRDLFHEAGLPDRAPENLDEFIAWARKLTNPEENMYGLKMKPSGWSTLSFLYSMGGRLVDKEENGNWRCVFDTDEAVDAYYYTARLLLEPFENEYGGFDSVVYEGDITTQGEIRSAMEFVYLDQRFFSDKDPNQYLFGPVPRGTSGIRGSEFNSYMTGIYVDHDKRHRDAAWEYIRFFDGPEARKVRTTTLVENGLGHIVHPDLLRAAGFPEYIRQVPKAWIEAYDEAMKQGVPEPYGKNCQMVYFYVSAAVSEVRADNEVQRHIKDGDEEAAKQRIREILKARVEHSNEKMLRVLTPEQRRMRNTVAYVVAVSIFIIFVLLFRKVFRTFARAQLLTVDPRRKGWQFGRYKWAYIILVPAVGSIAMWRYYPLVRGTVMAFQNYNVRGFSQWIGIENFANVLFDGAFWFAMWVSLKYALLFALFGFTAPIILAILLTEVPRGKVVFRTIYYLPAVLSGVVVIFLWKGFFAPYGTVNELLNSAAELIEWVTGEEVAQIRTNWIAEPGVALFCVLMPVIWVGMGPGCLIYLAALKTIPEEMYEAADVDGAGILHKILHITLPSIKSLILINFVGVIVATVKGGGQFVLAMTGGQPYTPYGETEVIGLHIYLQAFGYLRFGSATAMAWILGSMLVGFTVVQLQRLSRMEFRTASGVT